MENIFFYILHNDIDALMKLNLNHAHNIKNMFGQNPLIFACENNNTKIVELLINYYFDLNVKDKFGNTALDYAEEKNNIIIIKLLKNYYIQ
jgi:ankyrin repeat protein